MTCWRNIYIKNVDRFLKSNCANDMKLAFLLLFNIKTLLSSCTFGNTVVKITDLRLKIYTFKK